MKRIVLALGTAVFCFGAAGCNQSPSVAPTTHSANKPVVDADNTRVNTRDRNETAKTPIDQNENRKDLNITADIRKRIVDTKMSVNAQNVKVITQDGRVTLRGPVKTDEEKQTIERIALDVAGTGKVDNQLDIEASK